MAETASVLVVEDDDAIAMVLSEILEAEGYAVHRAARGGDAVEMTREHRPDAIVLDLTLPDLPGADVVARIRATHGGRAVPIVVVTGAHGGVEVARALGAAAAIPKPFDVDAVAQAVGSAIHGSVGVADQRGPEGAPG